MKAFQFRSPSVAAARLITRRSIITGPRFTQIVQGLPSIVPFVAPEEIERSRGTPFAVRLGANELTFGPSPRAIAAMQEAASSVWKYGDPKSHELRLALAAHHCIMPSNIVVGEGVDGLLAYTSHLLIGPGDALVTTRGTYPTLNYFVAGRGGVLHTVPYAPDDRQDLDALLVKAWEVDAKMLYVVNPDNPGGTWHSAARIEALIEGLPPGCLAVIDEAYHELGSDFDANARVAVDDIRVLRLRTFSKG
jgi:histidinol-phosphate aminotransferase